MSLGVLAKNVFNKLKYVQDQDKILNFQELGDA